MIARCYFNFVRLYVPAGSQLIGIEGIEPGSQWNTPGEAGTQVFGGYLVVQPGSEQQVTIHYQLPATLQPGNYALTIQRQAGSHPLPAQVAVDQQTGQTVLRYGNWRWP